MQDANARKPNAEQQVEPSLDLEELNVVEFPLAVLARHVPDGQKTITFQDTIRDAATGEKLLRTLLISASDSSVLPNWWDQDVLVALNVLTNRKNGFTTPVVEFSIYEVLKLMGLPNDSKNRQRVAKSLDNWQGVRFKYSHWRQGDAWLHPSAFCLIQDYNLSRVGRRRPDAPQIFTWSRIFFESVQASHTKPFDSGFYFSLSLPTSRRMYRFLDKRLWDRDRPGYTASLVSFCTEKLGMSRGYKPSEYPRKMMPAYDELVARGFLAEIPGGKRITEQGHGSYSIEFRRGRSMAKLRSQHQATDVPAFTSEPSELQKALMSRGVAARVAGTLIQEFSSERIGEKIELHDHLVRRKDKRISANSAGYLVKSIREDYSLVPGFETKSMKAERQRLAVEAKAKADSAKQDAEERAAREQTAREKPLRDYLASLTPIELSAVEEAAIQAADPFTRSRFLELRGKGGGGLYQALRDTIVMKYVAQQGLA